MSLPHAKPTFDTISAFFPQKDGLERTVLAVPEHGVVYVKNPKAGCTTVTLWLARIRAGESDYLPDNVHLDHRLATLGELGAERLVRMLAGEAFRFSFVRNPLARAESVWLDKVVRSTSSRPKLQRALGLPPDPGTPLSFEQFVTAIELQKPLTQNRHYRPQYLNLMHPAVTYDFVGRLERFDADLAELRERSGLPDVPVEAQNVSHRGRDSVYDGRPDLVRRVEAVYATDMELFDY